MFSGDVKREERKKNLIATLHVGSVLEENLSRLWSDILEIRKSVFAET